MSADNLGRRDTREGFGDCMQQRNLGRGGLAVSAVGLGCMSMSQSYGTPDDAESIRTVHRALDTESPSLIRPQFTARGTTRRSSDARWARGEQIVVASKCGIRPASGGGIDGADHLRDRRSCERAFVAGTDVIDLFYCIGSIRRHRSRKVSVRWLSSCAAARCGSSASRKPRRRRFAVRRRFTRLPRCRASTRSGTAGRNRRCCPSAASWASVSCRSVRWAAAFSRVR